MKYGVSAAFIILSVMLCHAQKLTVDSLVIDKSGKVSFNCFIEPHHSTREEYQLTVYTSADNFTKPLPLDPIRLKTGISQPVKFDGNNIIGDFDGKIEFDFRLNALVFPVQITSVGKKFKKGKGITIAWEDFHKSGWYDVEIYHEGELYQKVVGNHRGSKYYTTLPEDMTKGKYEIRVTPSNQKELVSEDYLVEWKTNKTGVIIGGGALVGVGIGILVLGKDTESDLPTPPALPVN
jgi:hypothetical protein